MAQLDKKVKRLDRFAVLTHEDANNGKDLTNLVSFQILLQLITSDFILTVTPNTQLQLEDTLIRKVLSY